MKETLHEIVRALQDARSSDRAPRIDAAWLDKLVRRRNREMHDADRRVAKKRLLPAYLRMRENDPDILREWGVDAEIDAALVKLLKAKPRRTASGVATITVLTKPWPCSSDCLYCPNDVRMPKSYLADEPACQRAERNFFDPYLQVASRLRVLKDMGHVTDKVELIVLGGTFSDYPESYRIWFVKELFRALNDAQRLNASNNETRFSGILSEGNSENDAEDVPCEAFREDSISGRIAEYETAGVLCEADDLSAATADVQAEVTSGAVSYNEAVGRLYGGSASWEEVSRFQTATLEELEEQQRANEAAAHRAVGLVVETRPDSITPASLLQFRQLGCTKVQMGIQSLSQHILDANARGASVAQVIRAFELLRLFGFKSHIHMMANLPGATPQSDAREYEQLVSDPRFIPDELKLYPCALVESSRLMSLYEAGEWRPYSEADLIELLAEDVLVTPPYTRISRMIRDISATDIVAGNKKTNLRQMVEERVGLLVRENDSQDVSRGTSGYSENAAEKALVQEMRMREIATGEVEPDQLRMECIRYETTVSSEYFLQWVTPENRLAGFLRLSIPNPESVGDLLQEDGVAESVDFKLAPDQAMIREVHVYGKVAALHEAGESAQHAGLGRKLIEEACEISREAGRAAVNVISSVGTREYYRGLGFADNGLYQTRDL